MDDSALPPCDFDEFHRRELPALLADRGPVFVSSDAARVRPIAFRLPDGRAYTYVPDGATFAVVEGDASAATVVELDADAWRDFRWELQTCFALLYAERLVVVRGGFGQLTRWEAPLRVAFDGQDRYDLENPPPLLDASGAPLDLAWSFSLDDADLELADFLARAGFLHLRGVLDAGEVSALNSVVDAAVTDARPDDRKSWWTTVDGVARCCRVNYLNERSTDVAELGKDPRFRRIAALSGVELVDAFDRLDGNGVVIKVPGASEGLTDLPWHRDCGMGGHPVKCPMLNVGIQLDAANCGAGRLEMIAGSHLGTSRLPSAGEAERLPVVALDTEPGDLTVHFGHTLHAAPPPQDPSTAGRRALYLSFVQPRTIELVGPGQGYNDVLFTHDGTVRHVDALT